MFADAITIMHYHYCTQKLDQSRRKSLMNRFLQELKILHTFYTFCTNYLAATVTNATAYARLIHNSPIDIQLTLFTLLWMMEVGKVVRKSRRFAFLLSS